VTCGFVITKVDLFPTIAARGAGQIVLNITVPCLMFSKIVPAFSPDNIPALGPLVLIALLYEAIGILCAWTIKQFFWVPHQFRYGILVAGGWANVGDIRESTHYISDLFLALV
jgi:predicted permease